jgi:hypothetical protein
VVLYIIHICTISYIYVYEEICAVIYERTCVVKRGKNSSTYPPKQLLAAWYKKEDAIVRLYKPHAPVVK